MLGSIIYKFDHIDQLFDVICKVFYEFEVYKNGNIGKIILTTKRVPRIFIKPYTE